MWHIFSAMDRPAINRYLIRHKGDFKKEGCYETNNINPIQEAVGIFTY